MKWGLTKKGKEQDSMLDSFERDISKVFDDFFSIRPSSMFDCEWSPCVDIEEDEKNLRVVAEIPGIDEKDLNVSIERNMLIISGEKKEEKTEKDAAKRYVKSERSFGSFYRSIPLPEDIVTDSVKAKFKNGVLTVEMGKSEQAKPRKIQIDVK